MSITPPPMPEPVGKIFYESRPYEPGWVSNADAFDGESIAARDSQWIKRIEAEKRLQAVTDNAYAVARERIAALEADRKMLRSALQWMVDNDNTYEGDEPVEYLNGQSWNEHNAYWIEGLNNARNALEKTK